MNPETDTFLEQCWTLFGRFWPLLAFLVVGIIVLCFVFLNKKPRS